MEKRMEISVEESTWNKATDFEMTFILLARDVAAPATIRFWIAERIRLGKNKPDDVQLAKAEYCATEMERQQGPK